MWLSAIIWSRSSNQVRCTAILAWWSAKPMRSWRTCQYSQAVAHTSTSTTTNKNPELTIDLVLDSAMVSLIVVMVRLNDQLVWCGLVWVGVGWCLVTSNWFGKLAFL